MVKKLQKTFIAALLILMVVSTVSFANDADLLLAAEDSESIEGAELTETLDSESSEEIDKTADEETESEEPVDTTGSTTLEDEMLSSDYFKVGESVESTQIIDGNAYIIGSDVTFSSIVGGDVFILGNNVSITEDAVIYGNLYVAASKLTIDGFVYGGDLYATCGTLEITENGAVNRDIRAAASTFTFNGGVGRNVYLDCSELSIGESSQIYGNLNYKAKEAIQIPSNVVKGSISFNEAEDDGEIVENKPNPVVTYLLELAQALIYTLAVLGVLVLVTPKFLGKLENIEATKFLPAFGLGLVGIIAPVICVVVLMCTVIGVSVAFALLGAWLILLGLAKSISIIALAGMLAKKVQVLSKAHNILAVIILSVVVWAIGFIPFVGGLISFVLFTCGIGLAILNLFKKKQQVVEE
ncbi:MAG: polymer-forming cytoskeletal protein [Clostridia bacterium]|nr:polymer-forming cytoskeletal protein [Clostridia bacterium]